MKPRRYTAPAMLIHWAQAAVVLWLLWRGWSMIDLPKGAERTAAYGLHKSWGLVALGLIGLRILWRRGHPPPPALSGGFEAAIARAVHHALYGLMLIAPLAGVIASQFTPYALKFFGLELPQARLARRGHQRRLQGRARLFRLGHRRPRRPARGRCAEARHPARRHPVAHVAGVVVA